MSWKVQKYRVDDLAAAEDPNTEVRAKETIHFAFDGQAWEIDLCGKNAQAFRDVLAPYTRAGKRIRAGYPRRSMSDRRRSQQVRSWAKKEGIEVSDRGRIPARVVAEFEAARKAQAA